MAKCVIVATIVSMLCCMCDCVVVDGCRVVMSYVDADDNPVSFIRKNDMLVVTCVAVNDDSTYYVIDQSKADGFKEANKHYFKKDKMQSSYSFAIGGHGYKQLITGAANGSLKCSCGNGDDESISINVDQFYANNREDGIEQCVKEADCNKLKDTGHCWQKRDCTALVNSTNDLDNLRQQFEKAKSTSTSQKKVAALDDLYAVVPLHYFATCVAREQYQSECEATSARAGNLYKNVFFMAYTPFSQGPPKLDCDAHQTYDNYFSYLVPVAGHTFTEAGEPVVEKRSMPVGSMVLTDRNITHFNFNDTCHNSMQIECRLVGVGPLKGNCPDLWLSTDQLHEKGGNGTGRVRCQAHDTDTNITFYTYFDIYDTRVAATCEADKSVYCNFSKVAWVKTIQDSLDKSKSGQAVAIWSKQKAKSANDTIKWHDCSVQVPSCSNPGMQYLTIQKRKMFSEQCPRVLVYSTPSEKFRLMMYIICGIVAFKVFIVDVVFQIYYRARTADIRRAEKEDELFRLRELKMVVKTIEFWEFMWSVMNPKQEVQVVYVPYVDRTAKSGCTIS